MAKNVTKEQAEMGARKATLEEVKEAKASGKLGGEVKKAANIYTYVGGGEDSPRVIEFMGKQKFVRGQATEVTDPEILAKIGNNPCFIEGEVESEELHDYDEKAKKEADEQRKKDKETDKAWKKLHNRE